MDKNIREMLKTLKAHHSVLTKQEFKTIKGQIISGDIEGGRKGLVTLLNKKLINR